MNFQLFSKFKAPFPPDPCPPSPTPLYLGSRTVCLLCVHLSLALQTSHAHAAVPFRSLPKNALPPTRAPFQTRRECQTLQEGWGMAPVPTDCPGPLTRFCPCPSRALLHFRSLLLHLPCAPGFLQVWPRDPASSRDGGVGPVHADSWAPSRPEMTDSLGWGLVLPKLPGESEQARVSHGLDAAVRRGQG